MKLQTRPAFFVAALALASCFASAQTYPPYVKGKTLYAKNDFRGKAAPKLEVGQWLTGVAPSTKGKVVLIDFWATWCGPCRGLIPELNDYKKKFGNDLVVIGISDEPAETVKGFMKTTPMKYNVAVDPSAKMSHEVGVQGIPHVMVISADGIVRWQGFSSSSEDELTAEKIAQIIAANKAAVAKARRA